MANTLVKPSTIIGPEIFDLSPCDQFAPRMYMSFLLCFQLDSDADPQKVYSELRCGLSDALVEYPVMAGRVVTYDTARDRIQIRLSCDDGVLFQYNDLTSPELQPPFPDFHHLEQSHFSPVTLGPSLSSVQEVYPTGSDCPALYLQANFIKRGLLLAFCPHHSTADALGWTGFLRSWAKYTSAATNGLRVTPRRSLEIMNRSLLFQVRTDVALEDCHLLVKIDNVAETLKLESRVFNAAPTDRAFSNILNIYWYFSPERLQALKTASQSKDKVDSWVSTNDALCALLWRHITIARQLRESLYETSSFQIPCSIRGRLSPKLDPEYAGNANIHGSCSYSIEKLCSTAPDCQSSVANAVREAINRVDDPMVRNLFGTVDSLPKMRSAKYNFNLRPGPDFWVTTFADYDWYGLDWGNHLGKIARQRYIFQHLPSFAIILPRCRDGGLEVFLTLEAEVFERLRLDETFTTFAELRCCGRFPSSECGGIVE